jgi:hypothetical protein
LIFYRQNLSPDRRALTSPRSLAVLNRPSFYAAIIRLVRKRPSALTASQLLPGLRPMFRPNAIGLETNFLPKKLAARRPVRHRTRPVHSPLRRYLKRQYSLLRP